MIPFAGAIRITDQPIRGFRLGIPLVLLWIVLFPAAVLLAPVIIIASFWNGVNPLGVLKTLWRMLSALTGTQVEVANDRFSVFFHIF